MNPDCRTIQSTCKYCRIPVTPEIDTQCPDAWTNRLLPLCACNRCADFRRRKYTLTDRLVHECIQLILHRQGARTQHDQPSIVENITELSKGYAALVCAYYRISLYWLPDFVDQLTERPGKAEELLAMYSQLVCKEARKAKV